MLDWEDEESLENHLDYSLIVILWVPQCQQMQVQTTICSHPISITIDLESTHTFINKQLITKLKFNQDEKFFFFFGSDR